LFVLDEHTGNISAVSITSATKSVVLKVGDFHAPPAPPEAVQAQAPDRSVHTRDDGTSSALPPAQPAAPAQSPVAQILSWLLGLAALVAIVWALNRVIASRGEALVNVARKAGIELPDPMSSAVAEQSIAPGRYVSPKVAGVEAVPESVGEPVPPGGFYILSAAQRPTLQSARLIGMDGSVAGQVWSVGPGENAIGRDEASAIRIVDGSVSRKHAVLRLAPGEGAEIEDSGSANGVFVGGLKVDHRALLGGEIVQIGRVRLKFDYN